ncbi:hypothetical protein TNCV_4943661 [Trichonephila clavipes]|nr:hypothetical protein TNCV_4943661 [Trichonephila clavipes]
MVKESRHPSDNRRSLSSKNRVVISDVERMGYNRNRWRDGQVCPDVGQGIMAPLARRPGRRREEPGPGWRKRESPALDRESMRGEPWLEQT